MTPTVPGDAYSTGLCLHLQVGTSNLLSWSEGKNHLKGPVFRRDTAVVMDQTNADLITAAHLGLRTTWIADETVLQNRGPLGGERPSSRKVVLCH